MSTGKRGDAFAAESWTGADGSRHWLFRLASGRHCLCQGFALDAATQTWTETCVALPSMGIDAAREAILATSLRRVLDAPPWFLRGSGTDLSGGGLVSVLDTVNEGRWGPDPETARFLAVLTGSAAEGASQARSRSDLDDVVPASAFGPTDVRLDAGIRPALLGGPVVVRGDVWAILGALEPWTEDLRAAMCPAELGFLPNWSAATFAHYMHPDLGRWRRQAGDAYPFVSPVIARDPETARLVDAGRPFEARLVERLREWLDPAEASGLTVAKLRRLRGLRTPWAREMVRLAARLPVHLVPVAGGERSGPDPVPAQRLADVLGLDLPRFLSRATMPPGKYASALGGIRDMADLLADHLVEPVLGGEAPQAVALSLAGRALYGGLTLDAACELQRRWHAALASFEDTLPPPVDRVAWPALFQPWSPPGMPNIRIECLTLPSALKAEGSFGSDALGPGLRHCAGGYARACHAREKHVAGVRVLTPAGWRRLSTVEMHFSRTLMYGTRLRVIQHQGDRNGPPDPRAVVAVDELAKLVASHGFHVDKAVSPAFPREPFDDGLDRTDPAVRAALFRAWKPYLRRHVASPEDLLRPL